LPSHPWKSRRYEDTLRQNLPEKLSRLWSGRAGSQVELVGQRPQFSVSSSQFSPATSSRHAGEFTNEFTVWLVGAAMPISEEVQGFPYPDVQFISYTAQVIVQLLLEQMRDTILLDIVISG
jgi:hypothetical protein